MAFACSLVQAGCCGRFATRHLKQIPELEEIARHWHMGTAFVCMYKTTHAALKHPAASQTQDPVVRAACGVDTLQIATLRQRHHTVNDTKGLGHSLLADGQANWLCHTTKQGHVLEPTCTNKQTMQGHTYCSAALSKSLPTKPPTHVYQSCTSHRQPVIQVFMAQVPCGKPSQTGLNA